MTHEIIPNRSVSRPAQVSAVLLGLDGGILCLLILFACTSSSSRFVSFLPPGAALIVLAVLITERLKAIFHCSDPIIFDKWTHPKLLFFFPPTKRRKNATKKPTSEAILDEYAADGSIRLARCIDSCQTFKPKTSTWFAHGNSSAQQCKHSLTGMNATCEHTKSENKGGDRNSSSFVTFFLFPAFLACVMAEKTDIEDLTYFPARLPCHMLFVGGQWSVLQICRPRNKFYIFIVILLFSLLETGYLFGFRIMNWSVISLSSHLSEVFACFILYGIPMHLWKFEGNSTLSIAEASVLSQFSASLLTFICWKQSSTFIFDRFYIINSTVHENEIFVFISGLWIPFLVCTYTSIFIYNFQWPSTGNKILVKVMSLLSIGMAICFILFCSIPATRFFKESCSPFIWLLSLVFENYLSFFCFIVWLSVSVVGLVGAYIISVTATGHNRLIRNRKTFHFIILTNFWAACQLKAYTLLFITINCIMWVLAACEVIRASKIFPAFSYLIMQIYSPFVDARDSETLVSSHLFLFLGVATPISLHFFCSDINSIDERCVIFGLSGVIFTGVGDAMAAIVGSSIPSPKLPATISKSYIGCFAFICASTATGVAFAFSLSNMENANFYSLTARLFLASTATGLFEAYTPDIDNFHLTLVGYIALHLMV